MHPAAESRLARVASEYATWRAVPDAERSPAPAWWWQPAFEVRDRQELMSPIWCHHLELPIGSTYAAGAALLRPRSPIKPPCPGRRSFRANATGIIRRPKPKG
jgi:hypothetical protein